MLLPLRVIGSTQNDKILVKTPINLVYPPKNTTITYFLNSTLSTKRNTNLCEAYPRILVVIDTIRAHSIISYLCVYIYLENLVKSIKCCELSIRPTPSVYVLFSNPIKYYDSGNTAVFCKYTHQSVFSMEVTHESLEGKTVKLPE